MSRENHEVTIDWEDGSVTLNIEFDWSEGGPGYGQCPDDPGEIDIVGASYNGRELKHIDSWKEEFFEAIHTALWELRAELSHEGELEAKISAYEDKMNWEDQGQ